MHTYNSYNQLPFFFVDPDQEGVVHDKVTGQKLGVMADCQGQHRLGVWQDIQRAVYTGCNDETENIKNSSH